MPYDDDPYWFQKKANASKYPKPKKKIKNESVQSRHIPDASEVMARIEAEPRQAQPDPLLVEWMERKAKENAKE
jgi:hypothetical protein